MKQQCRICQKTFDYCHACAINKSLFKDAGYCGEDCYHISMILQKYGSNVLSAAETIKELKPYGVDKMFLRPNIELYYQSIVSAAKPKRKVKNIEEVVPQEDVEIVVNTDEDMTISEKE